MKLRCEWALHYPRHECQNEAMHLKISINPFKFFIYVIKTIRKQK